MKENGFLCNLQKCTGRIAVLDLVSFESVAEQAGIHTRSHSMQGSDFELGRIVGK